MLTLLGSLIIIYLRLGVGRKAESQGERWFVHLPFSIYLGWITVATVANITAALDFFNWNGFGLSPEAWTYIMLAVAVGLTGLMAYFRQDIAYMLVPIWAFIAIGVEQADTPQITTAANLAAVVVGIFVVIVLFQKLRQSRSAQ
jgi:hypothetical protein